jgi:ABC-type glycerol-3-phosphate transport system permease component
MASTLQPAQPVRRPFGRPTLPQILLYTALIAYAGVSLLPLFMMVSSSLMTLGEVNSGARIPARLNFSPCILVTTDEYVNEAGDVVTSTRALIDIPEEYIQGLGFRSGGAEPISRQEHFRIPFLTNYCAAWQSANLGRYIYNTLRIVLITLIGLVSFSTLAAYAFARIDFAGKNLLFGIMLATLMVPEMVQNLPNFLIVNQLGEFSGAEGLGLCDSRNCWINNWPALTIPFMANAISIFLMRQHFATIPDDLWDAARIDGAGHLRFLVQVVLPLSKAALFVVILFSFLGTWNSLAWPLLVTNDDSWRPISTGLQAFLQTEGNLAHLRMAGSVITILPVLALYALTQRQFIEGISSSGLKG